MKKPVIFSLLLLTACSHSAGDSSEREAKSINVEESAPVLSEAKSLRSDESGDYLTSFAASNAFSDSLHRFVRKANLSFSTKNLLSATVGIEDLVRAQKGYIEHSGLTNETVYSESVQISKEEELIVSRIRPAAQLNVRVPVGGLDTFLRSLHPFVTVLYSRNVETENIAFETLLSRLQRIRIKKHSERALAAKGSPDVDALDNLLQREMQSDQNLVNELQTEERVQYASVSLSIKGTEYLLKERSPLFNNDNYEPSFPGKAGASFITGWNIFTGLVLAIVSIWPVLLILGGIWWGFRRYGRRKD